MTKPSAPVLTGLPKMHKQNIPIRPLINFRTSPTYSIAKHLNKWLNENIKLEHNWSIKNNIELVEKIRSITIPKGAKMASFDVTNMYSNIPVDETINITGDLLIKNKVDPKKAIEAIKLLKDIAKQNYFTHNKKFYCQKDGLPMGSPLSGTLADIYMNHFEKNYIHNHKNKYNSNILYYHRYVDDIILMFRGTKRQIDNFHNYINNINQNIKFTLEIETNNHINFLDLTITNISQRHQFKIYRKNTQTDHTIHKLSNHPQQQKMAAYRYMLHRMNTIPMNQIDYNEEKQIIIDIAIRNGYKRSDIDRINRRILIKLQQQQYTTLNGVEPELKKYISVEYNKNSSNIINKIFKEHGYDTAYKTNNKLQQLLKPKTEYKCDSGVYKLVCNDCPGFYIGQTGRSFEQRFKEHVQEMNVQKAYYKSNYAQHLKKEKHTYTDQTTNMEILYRINKGDMLNRLEEYEIYKHRSNTLLLNEKVNTKTNKLYDIIQKRNQSTQS